jgi:ATP adenylyltransferase
MNAGADAGLGGSRCEPAGSGPADASASSAAPRGADAWERLWTPHRIAYVRGEHRPADGSAGDHCPFCRAPGLSADEGLVVARGSVSDAILNLFPYNPGHMLICPYRHVADYTELTAEEVGEIAEFTQITMRTVRKVAGAHGFNLGMNQGAIAGAGISAHLHQHVVPRWSGDANFMPVIGGTKTMPQLLADTRMLVAAAWG